MRFPVSAPTSIETLLQRAHQLTGQSFAQLAEDAGLVMPNDLKRDKGWVGMMLEQYLGASAGSKPLQDFPELGVELKTLPVDEFGQPLETTFVCVAPLVNTSGLNWLNSNVRNKLSCVLWLPIDGRRAVPLGQRVVGQPFLWRPTAEQDQALQRDWEEHMDRISLGEVEAITARQGEFLQIRPKAADGRALTDAVGPDGQIIQVRPRGFYLKKTFTRAILEQVFNAV
ncbi:DNA mismatch repair protein MutH [Idiomarina fontislapidosi]|uniref:DNA mismatch repair protein MutH n=1 Tax=Idiomarina fontislapidosi TaxID=263723 RepID=A0A432Y282_9GAMM|nr:DNA mismatch repair endonuclease MutH [Idiomarina fontislapidosi]PYE33214.1 DNA mismatch repair protein MutH [Idiomarina fontislapidosi]RUO55058.1 DNA mismatch repair endonuclease MutH [Idiomarina fontislapidosi]